MRVGSSLFLIGVAALSAVPAHATIVDTGDVVLTGNDLVIGGSADGSRTVSEQTDGPYDSVNLGFDQGVTGTLSLDGATFATTGRFSAGVGNTVIPPTGPFPIPGDAVVDLSNGSRLETGSASLAGATITLDGGSSWVNAGAIEYGVVAWLSNSNLPGTAISLSDGASLSTQGFLWSNVAASTSHGIELNIDGPGTSWQNDGQLVLTGRSVYSLSNGAMARDEGVRLQGSAYNPRVLVDGIGSSWETGPLNVALTYPDQEVAEGITVSNGAHVTSSRVGVGSFDSSFFLLVTGAGSKWSVGGPASFQGDAVRLSINAGGILETGDTTFFGLGSASSGGGAFVSGSESLWDLDGDLSFSTGSYGDMSVGVGQGGRVLVEGDTTITTGCSFSCLDRSALSIGGAGSLFRVGRSLTLDNSSNRNRIELVVSSGGRAEAGIETLAIGGADIILHGGTLATPLVSLQGGTLIGEGTVEGDVMNAGRVAPGVGAGALDVTGAFTQTSAGKLVIALGGTEAGIDYAVLAVLGTSALAGTLEVVLADGYQPTPGDVFEVLRTGARVGEFGSYLGLDLGGGLSLVPEYGPDSLVLRAVPEPTTASLIALGLVAVSAARRRRH